MDIIEKGRELAAELQKTQEYTEFCVAKEAADKDEELQDMIGKFNLKKLELNRRIHDREGAREDTAILNDEIRELYREIMANSSMIAYNTAKAAMDKAVNFISHIIIAAANGEDPYSVTEESLGCSGSCESCGGCH